ncbi:MAG TPA: tRNA (adenosine(37)-N6)-threonylcarbamoyltransferase complex ATPase subunit type 1 TsaE [Dehalococcoidia bacterium]
MGHYPMTIVRDSRGPAETRRLGERLARLLRPGDVVLLQGELGAGKTCFAQGIGRGLRVREPVKSSSFVLVNEYHGRLHVYHADLFRLEDPAEVADLALEETARDGLLLVEWPDRAPGELPPEHLLVLFEMTGGRTRRISLTPRGERYEALVSELEASSAPRSTAHA